MATGVVGGRITEIPTCRELVERIAAEARVRIAALCPDLGAPPIQERPMPITLALHDRIAEIIFDWPPVNAFDTSGWELIPRLVAEAGADADVRCVLIRAEGRGFCGGVDIKEMQAHPERIVKLNRDNYLTFKAIRDCPVPVVSALHGFVIGGGVNIAGASDVLIAAEGAYFSLPEIDRGAMGGAAFMSRMLPLHKVRAAFFTGGRVSVEEAYRLGAVERWCRRSTCWRRPTPSAPSSPARAAPPSPWPSRR